MTRVLLQILNSRLRLPPFIVYAALGTYNKIYRILKRNTLWSNSERARIAEIINSTRERELLPCSRTSLGTITINIVATEKDIELLVQVIEFAIKALLVFEIVSIRIIVPNKQISRFAKEVEHFDFQFNFEVIPENELLSYEIGRDIFGLKFPSRMNWCYQQFLKVESVLSSKSKYALVVDCDTLLLNPRAWLDNEDFTHVMPTLEHEPQYENVLQGLGIINIENKWSFVPHHMLYEIEKLRTTLIDLGIEDTAEFAVKIESLANAEYLSPFCIDYSLYGHSIFSRKGHKSLIRWANVEVPRHFAPYFRTGSKSTRLFSSLFNSVSFHSWKESS